MVLAWVVIQLADILLDTFSAPEWAMRTLTITLAVGFPVAIGLFWVFEITTIGVKRTEDVALDESVTYLTGRRIDFVIIGILTVAVAIFTLDRFVKGSS